MRNKNILIALLSLYSIVSKFLVQTIMYFISLIDTIGIIFWLILLLVFIGVFVTSYKMFSLGDEIFMALGAYPPIEEFKRPVPSESRQRPRPRAKVKFNFNEHPHPRVSRLESLTVTYFNPDGSPREITIDDEDMVKVTIKLHLDEKDLHEFAGIFSEVGYTMIKTDTNTHFVQFAAKKSGVYIISVRIYETHIAGSPFFFRFLAAAMYPEKSVLLGTYPPAAFGVSENHKMAIEIRDFFDNLCRGLKDVDTKLFQLAIEHVDNRDHGKVLKENDFEVWFSVARAGNVGLGIRVLVPGIYVARLEYDGRLIQNGIFEFVVLHSFEMLTVKAFTHSPKYPMVPYVFQAEYQEEFSNPQIRHRRSKSNTERSVSSNSSSNIKTRSTSSNTAIDFLLRKSQVDVFLSIKNISVSKKFWKFFNKKLMSGKVTLNTKITVICMDSVRDKATFEISDGVSSKIRLTVSNAALRIACGILFSFLRQKSGNAGSFSEKVAYFYGELKKRFEYLHSRTAYIEICVDRRDLLISSFHECQRLWKRDWFRLFKLEFLKEPGVDGGGIRREFFELLCTDLFETSGLFRPIGNSRLVHPNPMARKSSKWNGRMYNQIWEFCGRIVGKALFESAMGGPYKLHIKAKFSRSFLAQLLGLKPNYRYFEQDDPELFIGKVKYILENNVSEEEDVIYFVDEDYGQGGRKVVELIPNGSTIAVTEANKVEYLNALAIYRLRTRVHREIAHFLHGLNSIIPEDSLGVFDENELELLICGRSTYTLHELQKYHRLTYENFKQPYISKHARVIDWFWTVVANMTDDEKGRLLQFITGSSILPTGGLRRLVPMIEIKPVEEFGRFPHAHTCSNLLCLPDQRDFETFEKRLILAITEGYQGFEIM